MPNAGAVAGKQGRVQVNGVNLNLDKWKVTLHAVDIPTTNFEDDDGTNTFTSGITGPREADLEFNGFFDTKVGGVAATTPFSGPAGVTPGAGTVQLSPGLYVPTNPIKLWPKKAAALADPPANTGFVFTGGVRIIQSAVDNDVNGRVNLAFQGKSNGVFTVPTSAV